MFPGIEGAIGRDIYAFRPHSALDYKYIFYALKFSIDQLIIQAQGDIPGLSKSHILDHRIGLPGIQEQRRISSKIEELFSELDHGIPSLKTAREQLKVYRQALLIHTFEGKLTAPWRDEHENELETADQLLNRIRRERESYHQEKLKEWRLAVEKWEAAGGADQKPPAPKPLSQLAIVSADDVAELPVLPRGYIYTYLANLGDLARGKSKHRPRNDPQLLGGPYPFIQTGDVRAANRVIRNHIQTYTEFGLAQSKLWPKDTLCITIAANIAETAFLGFDACFPDSVVGFSAIHNLVLPEYIELFIKAVRARIEAYAPATAQKNINLTTLENLIVPLCSIDEQRYLVREVESIMSVIHENEEEIEANLGYAESLRQSILKKAFSGQLVSQDKNDESASTLLKRIASRTENPIKNSDDTRKDAA
jgi:type I restriction enzyme S subunit